MLDEMQKFSNVSLGCC